MSNGLLTYNLSQYMRTALTPALLDAPAATTVAATPQEPAGKWFPLQDLDGAGGASSATEAPVGAKDGPAASKRGLDHGQQVSANKVPRKKARATGATGQAEQEAESRRLGAKVPAKKAKTAGAKRQAEKEAEGQQEEEEQRKTVAEPPLKRNEDKQKEGAKKEGRQAKPAKVKGQKAEGGRPDHDKDKQPEVDGEERVKVQEAEEKKADNKDNHKDEECLLYTYPSLRHLNISRMTSLS